MPSSYTAYPIWPVPCELSKLSLNDNVLQLALQRRNVMVVPKGGLGEVLEDKLNLEAMLDALISITRYPETPITFLLKGCRLRIYCWGMCSMSMSSASSCSQQSKIAFSWLACIDPSLKLLCHFPNSVVGTTSKYQCVRPHEYFVR